MKFKRNIEIKYISRKKAAEKLCISLDEFKELAILTNTRPVQAKNKNKYDHLDIVFYRIEDIQKMIETDAYLTINRRRRHNLRKENYIKYNREDKLKNFVAIDYDYHKLVKEKYKTFTESIIGLNESVNTLFLLKSLYFNIKEFQKNHFSISMEENLNEAEKCLNDFKEFIKKNGFLKYIYLCERGYYYFTKFNNIEILWLEPYKKSEELVVEDFDLSEMIYSLRFSLFHLKITMLKLNKLNIENIENKKNDGIFKGVLFYLKDYTPHLSFAVECCGGEIINDHKIADFYVTEKEIIDFDITKKYVQPMFIFECLNKNTILEYTNYSVGSELALQECPFEKDKSLEFDHSLLQYISKSKRNKIDEILFNAKENN